MDIYPPQDKKHWVEARAIRRVMAGFDGLHEAVYRDEFAWREVLAAFQIFKAALPGLDEPDVPRRGHEVTQKKSQTCRACSGRCAEVRRAAKVPVAPVNRFRGLRRAELQALRDAQVVPEEEKNALLFALCCASKQQEVRVVTAW